MIRPTADRRPSFLSVFFGFFGLVFLWYPALDDKDSLTANKFNTILYIFQYIQRRHPGADTNQTTAENTASPNLHRRPTGQCGREMAPRTRLDPLSRVIKLYSVWRTAWIPTGHFALLCPMYRCEAGLVYTHKHTCAIRRQRRISTTFSGRLLLCSSFPNQRSLSTQCDLG